MRSLRLSILVIFLAIGNGLIAQSNPPTTNQAPQTYGIAITNIDASSNLYLALFGATDQVCEIVSTINLSSGSWNIEAEISPDTNYTGVAIIPENGRPALFLSGCDWTGVDTYNNGVPDWWEWNYFALIDMPGSTNVDGSSLTLAEADGDLLEKATLLVVNALLATTATPESIIQGTRLREGKGNHRELWSPNYIGKMYKSRSEPAWRDPRSHWRRGHFRNQPYGAGLASHKIIWIERVFIL
jgi:hypothetical protein